MTVSINSTSSGDRLASSEAETAEDCESSKRSRARATAGIETALRGDEDRGGWNRDILSTNCQTEDETSVYGWNEIVDIRRKTGAVADDEENTRNASSARVFQSRRTRGRQPRSTLTVPTLRPSAHCQATAVASFNK